MKRCRNCGSTAQNKRIRVEYTEDGEIIIEVYKCGCGGYTVYEYKLIRTDSYDTDGKYIK